MSSLDGKFRLKAEATLEHRVPLSRLNREFRLKAEATLEHQVATLEHQAPISEHQAPISEHQAPISKHQAPSTLCVCGTASRRRCGTKRCRSETAGSARWCSAASRRNGFSSMTTPCGRARGAT